MWITEVDIYTPEAVIRGGSVQIENGRILSVGDPPVGGVDGPRIDGQGLLLIPGLIDMQCNGLCGHDVLDGTAAAMAGLAASLPQFGCTAVLPTIISAQPAVLLASLRAIGEAVQTPPPGASILGAHQEGPWLSPNHPGAHDPANIRPFNQDEWDAIQEAGRGTVRLVTLAPEVPGNEQATAPIVATGAIVSLGHSGANYEQAEAAYHAGARMATHLFNAMVPLLHRTPGVAGAALDLREMVPGIIPDGYHIHPAIVRLAVRAKGSRGVVVVTDSVPVTGLPPGEYITLGKPVRWDGETVRLLNGTLAGSGLTPIEALRRYIHLSGLDLHEALPAMTSTPARLLGLEGERGVIAPGARADLVLLTPDLRVRSTLVGEEIVYQG